MTTYSTSFDSDTVGSAPSGWTARWVTANNTWAVRSKASASGGQCLENTGTAFGHHLLTWDTIDADANRANSEILALVRTSGSSSSDQFRLAVRGSGAAGAETAYDLMLTLGSGTLEIRRFVAGVATNLTGVTVPSLIANAWYYVRFRANGTSLQGKYWLDGTDEPSSWAVSVTDSTVTAAGWVGVGNYDPNGTRDIDTFMVGTNGDSPAIATSTATSVRVSQAVSEVALANVAQARVSQAVNEVAHANVAQARISQMTVEVAISAPIAGLVSQMVVEVAFSNAVAVTQQPHMIVLM